ncbi:MAG TPA: flagellin, partial [Pirellulaceae bacterium]|nr:flagellin [Pirellulaceae bacterium]
NYKSAIITASDTAAFTAEDFDIQGLESATISAVATDTARTLANKVNSQSDVTGVTATGRTKSQLAFDTADESYTLSFTSNNTTAVNVTFSVGAVDTAEGLASAVSSINDAASKTGVTAKLNDTQDGIILENASGENIRVDNGASSGGGITLGNYDATNDNYETGVAAAAGAGLQVVGYLEFASDRGFAIANSGGTNVADGSATLQSVSTIDVSNVAGANSALAIVDAALAAVNGQRARFGALQSRFENTVANLQTTSENLTASRSRIRDADFAAETAALTRSQILQQAGTAVLAQANAIPQNVLSLLQ